jgi:hypothetical protein
VWLLHARVWLLRAEWYFYTQSVISIRRVWILHVFDRHKSDDTTHECDFNTHKSDFYTQSAISIRRIWFYTQNVVFTHTRVILARMRVNITLTSVITTHSSVTYARRVRFHTHSVILTRTSVITTLTTVIKTLTRVISTHGVWF